MIPKSRIEKWLGETLQIFNHYMTPLPCPLPEIYFTTEDDYDEVRSKLAEETGTDITFVPKEYSLLDYIHGDRGYAILVEADQFPAHANQDFFMHLLWHELGHFYAINSETDNLHRFNDCEWTDGNRNKKQEVMSK